MSRRDCKVIIGDEGDAFHLSFAERWAGKPAFNVGLCGCEIVCAFHDGIFNRVILNEVKDLFALTFLCVILNEVKDLFVCIKPNRGSPKSLRACKRSFSLLTLRSG